MLFAVSPGSNGSGTESYVVYLPFFLAPGSRLQLEQPATSRVGDVDLKLEKLHHHYALSYGPFNSRGEAASRLDQLRAALLWFSLELRTGVSYPKAIGDLKLFETPRTVTGSEFASRLAEATGWTAVDGQYDSNEALIRPDHKRLIRWEVGRVTGVAGISVQRFHESLSKVLNVDALHRIGGSGKLKLAIEVYAAYRFELSENAQLLVLVSALETLLPEKDIPDHAKAVLAQVEEIAKVSRDSHRSNSPEWEPLDRLLSRLGQLKKEAIGKNLRDYVADVVSRHAKLGDPTDVANRLRRAYDTRSRLLHRGETDTQEIREHLSFLRDFVPSFLRALFREAAGV